MRPAPVGEGSIPGGEIRVFLRRGSGALHIYFYIYPDKRIKRNKEMKTQHLIICTIAAAMAMGGCCPQNGTQHNTAETQSGSNAVIEAIMARRSIRKYKPVPVEREKLEQVVECGIHAPNGMNRQPWAVRVVDNAEYIDGITAAFKAAQPEQAADPDFKNMFRNASAVIFIASPADGSGQVDCGLLGGNMVLAAQSLGLGTCCLGGPIRFMKSDPRAASYLERLDLPEGYELLYAIGIGYPDESPAAKPRDEGKVRFID